MLSKLQTLREERESGFTLIELLVVILIIGILSAIAIPAFLNQRKSAVDSSVQSDVSNAAKQVETLAIKGKVAGGAVTITAPAAGKQTISIAGAGTIDTQVSDGTVLTVVGSTGANTGYQITGTNTAGDKAAGAGFVYDSAKGGLLK